MRKVSTLAEVRAVEAEMSVSARWRTRTVYQQLVETASRWAERPALSFQLRSGRRALARTLTWRKLRDRVTRAANLFHSLGGDGEEVTVAYLLPNCPEAAITFLAGTTAGTAVPVNPLLSPEHIGSILRDSGARVLVTLAPFPQSDVAEKAARAVALAPGVRTILEVDLAPYLELPTRWLLPLLRPAPVDTGSRESGPERLDFATELDLQSTTLGFAEAEDDAVRAIFHTGGTTGEPKLTLHRPSGMLYNGWCGKELLFSEQDVILCPLPLFHVFAVYPVLMGGLFSGAHMVLPTPQGYRGKGVMENFWQIVARWQADFLITVPTAVSALMQQRVDADVSSLRYAICGSAPLPLELLRRFEAACGIRVLEGYGMTEATCLVACNPAFGDRRAGSVGLPMPYTQISVRNFDAEGTERGPCRTDEAGEICILSPGVSPGYRDPDRNARLFCADGALRTGDLGRLDADGYLWITGRAKDMIIRGGHNIDPALIEEALLGHPDVAFAGAVGQPDRHSGELPCVYVELVKGADLGAADLTEFARNRIPERAAVPRHVEILDDMPKTAVGKVFKPALRMRAITRVLDAAMAEAGLGARVQGVREDRRLGLVATVSAQAHERRAVCTLLGHFPTAFEIV
ncbi:acyl-CoA synthetase [Paroceanicella profunda]|uniref:Acyl-CoA synthetase n=1 Tax=Paroceanicella profunda TaxID=2579971 RepID=A0A5B8FU70_9RHOB|nr:acyl-CoA synthetase [Paroceanicella profunda]QDL90650.1 acyl-CoA synthetase [Paroceanicella profunda]